MRKAGNRSSKTSKLPRRASSRQLHRLRKYCCNSSRYTVSNESAMNKDFLLNHNIEKPFKLRRNQSREIDWNFSFSSSKGSQTSIAVASLTKQHKGESSEKKEICKIKFMNIDYSRLGHRSRGLAAAIFFHRRDQIVFRFFFNLRWDVFLRK